MSQTVAAAWRLLQDSSTETDTAATDAVAGTATDASVQVACDADSDVAPETDTGPETDTDAQAGTDTEADAKDAAIAEAAAEADAQAEAAAQLLEVVIGCEQSIAKPHARQMRALAALAASAELGTDQDGVVVDPTAPEVACALHWTPGAAGDRVALALDLVDLPVVLEALEAGRIDLGRAREIVDGSWGLDEQTRQGLCALATAFAQTHTRGQVRAWLVRALNRIDPDAAARRRKTAKKTRAVRLRPETDGMATLTATLTAEEAVACMEAIRARACGIDGGRDANQADVFVELLTGIGAADQIPVVVLITADGVELPGYGPVPADLAAELLGAHTTDPTDQPTTTRQPLPATPGPRPARQPADNTEHPTTPPRSRTPAHRPGPTTLTRSTSTTRPTPPRRRRRTGPRRRPTTRPSRRRCGSADPASRPRPAGPDRPARPATVRTATPTATAPAGRRTRTTSADRHAPARRTEPATPPAPTGTSPARRARPGPAPPHATGHRPRHQPPPATAPADDRRRPGTATTPHSHEATRASPARSPPRYANPPPAAHPAES